MVLFHALAECYSRTADICTNGTTEADMFKLNSPEDARETEICLAHVFLSVASPGVSAIPMVQPLKAAFTQSTFFASYS